MDSLNWMYLSQIKLPWWHLDQNDTVSFINRNLDILTDSMSHSEGLYEILIALTYQVNSTDIGFNHGETEHARQVLSDSLIIDYIYGVLQQCEIDVRRVRESQADIMNLNVGLFVVCMIVGIALVRLAARLWRCVDCLFNEVSYLSDSAIALARHTSLKQNNVLELVSGPCAMVDSQMRVVGTNTQWLAAYDESFDRIIGRSIGEIMRDSKFQTVSIEGTGNFLVYLKEMKEEVAIKTKLVNAERDLSLLKSVNTPRRFLSISSGREVTRFAVLVKIVQVPVELESLSPETWPNDCEEFESWLRSRVQDMSVREDCDLLHFNMREVTLFFGGGELFDPHILILSAVTLCFDALRFVLEAEWASGAMNVYISLSCGAPLIWEFHRDDVTVVNGFGPAVEKQMVMRECAELNSIVICADTKKYLDRMNIVLDMQQTANGNYIFIAPEMAA
jgi:hypothetical protein